METSNISQAFLRRSAAKHFVCLTYRAKLPTAPSGRGSFHFASCFVIETAGVWFLVTAGHVIRGIREALSRGVEVHNFVLHDKLAGNSFPGVPFDFLPEKWVVIQTDADGTDYAATPILAIIAGNLAAGGIEPIRENAWGAEPLTQYSHWLLAGMPSEAYQTSDNTHVLKLTLIPLIPAEVPPGSLVSTNRVCAHIVTQPDRDSVKVDDIDGMSGSPIFGLKERDGKFLYWLIGVQSSWRRDLRIVFFCPMATFLEGLKAAVYAILNDGAEDC